MTDRPTGIERIAADPPRSEPETPQTKAGRAMVAWWQAGRTHPPTLARHKDFVDFILEVEAEAVAAERARVTDAVLHDRRIGPQSYQVIRAIIDGAS